jgi:L-fuconolactonase
VAQSDDYGDIPIIDTHIHLYDTARPTGVPWPPKSDKVLYRPVLPAHFNEVADANGVAATVIVEASGRLSDNQWVLDLVKDDPGRYVGLVGHLSVGTDSFAKNLKDLSEDPRYVGIRIGDLSENPAFLTDAVWRDLELLAAMDQTLDVLLNEGDLEHVATIADRVPNLKILMNHAGGINLDGEALDADWLTAFNKAASYPNVSCKVSGLFQRSGRSPAPKDLTFYEPILDAMWKAFGEDRLIYGSNWPVTMRGGEYSEYKAIVMDYFSPKGRQTLEKLLYRNAQKFYGLSPLHRD